MTPPFNLILINVKKIIFSAHPSFERIQYQIKHLCIKLDPQLVSSQMKTLTIIILSIEVLVYSNENVVFDEGDDITIMALFLSI